MGKFLRKKRRLRVAFACVATGALAIGSVAGCSLGRWTKGEPSAGETAGGGDIGRYMAEQAEELSAIEGAKTEQVGEEIKVTWDSTTLFDFDSAMLTLESQRAIGQMADVFTRYAGTDIVVACHTDSSGPAEHSRKLTERRALSLRDCLVDLGVAPSRLRTEGHGGLFPVATNDTEEGRRMNRRVEIEIKANPSLKARTAGQQNRG